MSIKFRNYTTVPGITEDYHYVRDFLKKIGSTEFTYARWDWMITHGSLDRDGLCKIGLWEDSDEIVGIAVYDTILGYGYCLTLQEYEYLKEEILIYAKDNLSKDGKFSVVIPDRDVNLQDIALKHGFIATTDKESDAIFYLDKVNLDYKLPDGFKITTMNETYDLYQYFRVLWKGFNHELNGKGEFEYTKEKEISGNKQMKRPNVNLDLKIAVVAPDGNFVSYCGMWYDKDTEIAIIEPLATDPDYRKMGLGKAAVLEGVRRVKELGAKKVLVGSSQQFYYSIGMRPYRTATEWKIR